MPAPARPPPPAHDHEHVGQAPRTLDLPDVLLINGSGAAGTPQTDETVSGAVDSGTFVAW
jgi:hypothetical protein